MTLRQELNDFKVVLCQRVVFFVPCKVLILLVTNDDRFTKNDTCIGRTIRHLPLLIAQGNAKTSYLLRECSLCEGVITQNKVVGLDIHTLHYGNKTEHILLPTGTLWQTSKHHLVVPLTSFQEDTIVGCTEDRELIVALRTIRTTQPSLSQWVNHSVILIE